MKTLNLFYEEPEEDRWFKFDRYLRKIIRRILRGKPRPGGVMTISINLMKGLDKIGHKYRLNDYKFIKNNPNEIACIIGKPHLLFERKWKNPIIFGAGIFSHPIEYPNLLNQIPNIKRILVPGNWMADMFHPYYGDKTFAWPVGIDTEFWKPSNEIKTFDFLIYDKIRWNYQQQQSELIDPIIKILDDSGLIYQTIKYGNYEISELYEKLKNSKAVIFLCEHETQGLAYQQILATNTPILAWERGGYWQDPFYYPHRAKYEPVSAVPYWDNNCGIKFSNTEDFKIKVKQFIENINSFKPREYILENLTLEICAQRYLSIYNQVEQELK